MKKNNAVVNNSREDPLHEQRMHRRKFLLFSGTVASTALVSVVACKKENDGVNLGSGDTGVLNYAYALEQLEAAFYTQVMMTPFSGMSALETSIFTDIRDHEIAHREFLKTVLSSNAIQDLEVNFSSIDFTKRDSVLATAKAFEDLGVAAYNGAGKLLTNPAFLLEAGKIVSVEARHAAQIRDLISNGTFADNSVVDMKGLDVAKNPPEVLAAASAYVRTKLNFSNLPTS